MFDKMKNLIGGKGHIDVKSVQESVALGEMVLCHFEFYPMSRMVEPKYDAVTVKSINVTDEGIYAEFEAPKLGERGRYGSYVGEITCRGGIDGWSGLFNTREEAEKCFKDTMAAWKANIP